jgi:guanylate kinase
LVVISGPSGVGKSTVVRGVLDRLSPQVRLSVSATTRSPRPGEVEGRDYYFLSPEEFARRRGAGDFLECVEVFGQGHWYGTLWSEVRSSLAAGKWVILEIDVDGALEVFAKFPDAASIFIRPDSMEELERRLRARGTEGEEAIQRRLAAARRELALADRYEQQVVNVTVPRAVDDVCRIFREYGLNSEPATAEK